MALKDDKTRRVTASPMRCPVICSALMSARGQYSPNCPVFATALDINRSSLLKAKTGSFIMRGMTRKNPDTAPILMGERCV